jgi:hypothetical protein
VGWLKRAGRLAKNTEETQKLLCSSVCSAESSRSEQKQPKDLGFSATHSKDPADQVFVTAVQQKHQSLITTVLARLLALMTYLKPKRGCATRSYYAEHLLAPTVSKYAATHLGHLLANETTALNGLH